MIDKFIEVTFILIILYLILSRSSSFSTSMGVVSSAYTESIKTLQGR